MKYLLPFFFISFLVIPFKSYAYTADDVATHNTRANCWVIFENSVYDLSKYLPNHDRFLPLDSWCGKDMTEDFKSKAGRGQDHRSRSYTMLEMYKIGSIGVESDVVEEDSSEGSYIDSSVKVENVSGTEATVTTESESVTERKSPYSFILPFLITLCVYWVSFFLFKSKRKYFDGFWNTILFLLFVIPSFGFGLFMILQYEYLELAKFSFDAMYWHVELSVILGAIGISHFVQRFGIYRLQILHKK